MAETSASTANSIWDEIEQSESYLVSSMYEEAATLASSVLSRLLHSDCLSNQTSFDMVESAGMVYVQSLKGICSGGEILNELKRLFVSVTDVPVQVLLTGACLQISEGSYFGVREFLEEFLSKWSYVDGRYYVLDTDKNKDITVGCDGYSVLGIDQYCEVVEVYTVTFLGTVLNNVDYAISWIEKAALPEERRQVLLRRLHSLCSVKAGNVSHGSSLPLEDLKEIHSSSLKEPNVSERSSEALNTNFLPGGENVTKQASLKFSRQPYLHFWWFRPITLKLGNARVVFSNMKVLLGCLIFLSYFLFRKKQATVKRFVSEKILSVKKALVDLWQLAFSYKVNPLAAVQPLPAARVGH